jgi:hypothetical protein
MAFDDSTGGLDRHLAHTSEPLWGDDWGDRSPRSLFSAARVAPEREQVDAQAQAEYLERRARIAADATRSRSAPVEARLRAEQARSKTGSFGAVLAQAFAKERQRGKKR